MPNIVNGLGQVKVGVKPTPPPPPSTLMSSIYSAYNADSQGLTSLKTSLVSVYNGESNANDSYGSNNGTAVGGVTYTTGKIGNAFNFNRTNAYVNMGDVLDVGTSSWTYSMWFNPSQAFFTSTLFSKTIAAGVRGRVFAYIDNYKLAFGFDADASNVVIVETPASSIIANNWYHAVIQIDRTDKIKLYLNGNLVNLTTTNGTNNLVPYSATNYNTNNPFRIGAYTAADNTTPTNLYGGVIDAFNVWNRVLTQSEITELYNSGNGAQYITDNFYKPTTNDALNTYNGTAQGGLTYGVGKVGTAFQFNGTNAYVQLGDVMDIGTSSWSYSMWFNVSTTNNSMLFSKVRNSSSAGRIWAGTNSNKIYFAFETTGGSIAIETASNISTNTWYHITFVLDRNDKLKMYLNGTLTSVNVFQGTNNLIPYSSTNFNTNHPFRIGTFTDADNTTPIALFNGSIDAFNIWNRVLTQSEVTELYNSGNGKQYPF